MAGWSLPLPIRSPSAHLASQNISAYQYRKLRIAILPILTRDVAFMQVRSGPESPCPTPPVRRAIDVRHRLQDIPNQIK